MPRCLDFQLDPQERADNGLVTLSHQVCSNVLGQRQETNAPILGSNPLHCSILSFQTEHKSSIRKMGTN